MGHVKFLLTKIFEKIKKLELSSFNKAEKINSIFNKIPEIAEIKGLFGLFCVVGMKSIKINQARAWYNFDINYKKYMNMLYYINPINFKIIAVGGN